MATDFHVRVRKVLEAAVERRTSDRGFYIGQAVGPDAALRREVLSLLPHYLKVAGFEPKPPRATRSRGFVGSLVGAGEASPEDDEWKLPFSISPYRVVDVIGRGGMGVVYRGTHSTRPLDVAIKILRQRFVASGWLRFKREEELLRRLEHTGIVRFLHGGEAVIRRGPHSSLEDRRPYFVMEYIRGRPLVKYANEKGLGTMGRIALLVQICEAVEHAHHHGVVHCDLKPDNILVDETGQTKILDFGIARLQDFEMHSVKKRKHFAGTLAYSSPEQRAFRGPDLSPESDVYALGLIIHELLTGRLPRRIHGRLLVNFQNVGMEPSASTDCGQNNELQHVLRVILATALRGTRGRRYATAGELGADLAEVHRAFAPARRNLISTWFAALRREPAVSPTGHSRLLCKILRTRIGMGIEL